MAGSLNAMEDKAAKDVELSMVRLRAAGTVSANVAASVSRNVWADQLIVVLQAQLHAHKHEQEIRHEWPSTWWDAFKAKWYPNWLLRRFPVSMRVVRYQAAAFFPELDDRPPDTFGFLPLEDGTYRYPEPEEQQARQLRLDTRADDGRS